MLIKYSYLAFARSNFREIVKSLVKSGVLKSMKEEKHLLYSNFIVKGDAKGHLILMKTVNGSN